MPTLTSATQRLHTFIALNPDRKIVKVSCQDRDELRKLPQESTLIEWETLREALRLNIVGHIGDVTLVSVCNDAYRSKWGFLRDAINASNGIPPTEWEAPHGGDDTPDI